MVLNRQTDDQVEIPSTIFDRERARERTRDEGPSKSESRMRERETERKLRDLLNLSQESKRIQTFRIVEAIGAKDDINRWQIKQSFIKSTPSDPYHWNIQQSIGLTGFSAFIQTMREVLTVTQRYIASTFRGQDSR